MTKELSKWNPPVYVESKKIKTRTRILMLGGIK